MLWPLVHTPPFTQAHVKSACTNFLVPMASKINLLIVGLKMLNDYPSKPSIKEPPSFNTSRKHRNPNSHRQEKKCCVKPLLEVKGQPLTTGY